MVIHSHCCTAPYATCILNKPFQVGQNFLLFQVRSVVALVPCWPCGCVQPTSASFRVWVSHVFLTQVIHRPRPHSHLPLWSFNASKRKWERKKGNISKTVSVPDDVPKTRKREGRRGRRWRCATIYTLIHAGEGKGKHPPTSTVE